MALSHPRFCESRVASAPPRESHDFRIYNKSFPLFLRESYVRHISQNAIFRFRESPHFRSDLVEALDGILSTEIRRVSGFPDFKAIEEIPLIRDPPTRRVDVVLSLSISLSETQGQDFRSYKPFPTRQAPAHLVRKGIFDFPSSLFLICCFVEF